MGLAVSPSERAADWGDQITAPKNTAEQHGSNCYKHTELFWRFPPETPKRCSNWQCWRTGINWGFICYPDTEAKNSFIGTRKKTKVSYFFICVLCDRADAFLTSPWLHVWWSFSLLQVGEVPHFPLVPRFHVNSSFVAISSTRTDLLCTLILARVACVLELSRHTTMITKNGAVCTDNSKATIYWIESSRTSKGLKRFVRSWF